MPPYPIKVEVNNPILMRTLASDDSIAATRREAGVANNVSVTAWWKEPAHLLVWSAGDRGGGGVDEVVSKTAMFAVFL